MNNKNMVMAVIGIILCVGSICFCMKQQANAWFKLKNPMMFSLWLLFELCTMVFMGILIGYVSISI